MRRAWLLVVLLAAVPLLADTPLYGRNRGNGVFGFLTSGTSANADLVGQLTIAAGTVASSTYTFSNAYTSPPVCWFAPRNVSAATVQALNGITPQITATTLSFTVGSAPTSPLTVPYACIAQK